MNPTNQEIASDYELWEQYADPHGTMTEDEFDNLTHRQKTRMLSEMFPYEHGGTREGAGRKPSRKPLENLSTTIYKSDYNYLRKLAPTFREAIHQLVTERNPRT